MEFEFKAVLEKKDFLVFQNVLLLDTFLIFKLLRYFFFSYLIDSHKV